MHINLDKVVNYKRSLIKKVLDSWQRGNRDSL